MFKLILIYHLLSSSHADTTATQLMLLSATLIWSPATQIVLPVTTVLKGRDWTSCTVLTGRTAMRRTYTR